MKLELIYHTPDYHKLVETVARVCYQSYHKDGTTSHNFIKAIMAKGHISIASVGNIVFKLSDLEEYGEFDLLSKDLLNIHEITPFIKWSFVEGNLKSDEDYISMNMLTLLDILNNEDDFLWCSSIIKLIKKEVAKVPELQWFIDKSVELPEKENPYTALGIPELYKPIVLDQDVTKLKELGLNDYELGVHATITMNFTTDRSASLQFWRHWSGGCELSQRYVKRGDSGFRTMLNLEEKSTALFEDIKGYYEDALDNYESILENCANLGIHAGRAKEIARSVLPNAICTQLIQSRPLKNWQHLFKLRDSTHAQREIREDVIKMKEALVKLGVEV